MILFFGKMSVLLVPCAIPIRIEHTQPKTKLRVRTGLKKAAVACPVHFACACYGTCAVSEHEASRRADAFGWLASLLESWEEDGKAWVYEWLAALWLYDGERRGHTLICGSGCVWDCV